MQTAILNDGLRPIVVEPTTMPYTPLLKISSTYSLVRVKLTGDVTVMPPENGIDGCHFELLLVADGADRNLSFDDAIAVGEYADADPPLVIDSGSTAVVKMRYDGPRNLWSLDGLINSF